MMDKGYLGLTNEKETILKQFRKNVAEILKPEHDDRYLLRWLRARSFNLTNAEKMLREDVRFRKERRSDHLTRQNAIRQDLRKYGRMEFLGFDNYGQIVFLLNMGGCDCKGFARSSTSREATDYFIAFIEEGHRLLKEHNEKTGKYVEKYFYIADLKGLNVRELCDRQVMGHCIDSLRVIQDHYPEILHALYAVNSPKLVLYIFNLFKPFLDEAVIKKIKIFGEDLWQDELFKSIPKDIIPAYLGGTRCEPEGDPYCHAILNWVSGVPESFYLKNSPAMQLKDPGVKEKIVLPRSLFTVPHDITKIPSILSWEFQTKGYDIKFGLHFQEAHHKEDGNTEAEELIPTKTIDCHNLIEKNEYICETPGEYVLTFDNKQSWFTAKHLLYKTEVHIFHDNTS